MKILNSVIRHSFLCGMLIWFLFLSSSAANSQGFENRESAIPESVLYQTRKLVGQIEETVIQHTPDAVSPLRYSFNYTDTSAEITADISPSRQRITITLPGDSKIWENDKDSVQKLVSWLTLARIGLPPGHAPKIAGHWFIAGLTRKILGMPANNMTAFRYFPGAYTLASMDVFPELEAVVSPLPPDTHTPALYSISSEYAEILLDAARKNGILKNRGVERFLKAEINGSKRSQYEIFVSHAAPFLQKEQPFFVSLMLDTQIPKTRGPDCSEWFSNVLRHNLLGYYTPFSVSRTESLYRRLSRFTYLPENAEKEKTAYLRDIPLIRNEIPNLHEVIRRINADLSNLLARSSGEFHPIFAEIRSLLDQCHEKGGSQIQRSLIASEKKFFETAERFHALELYLKEAEPRHTYIPFRFELTLKSINELENSSRELYPEINDYLDRKWNF